MKDEEILKKLREGGVKATPQRLAIGEVIFSRRDHPTAEQIYEELKKRHPTISLATVYQTLHLLSKIGLIQEIGFADKPSKFDPNTSPHINLVCLECGRIEDYTSENFKRLWAEIVKELGFKPLGQRIDVYTYCNECLEKLSLKSHGDKDLK